MVLQQTKRTDKRLLERMENHYSQPKGFVGRNICYAVLYDNVYYGHIVAGSATRFLPGRNAYFNITLKDLNHIVNNIFFNVNPPINQKYPIRNFTTQVINLFAQTLYKEWERKYGDTVYGFETLIEKPRSGELYLRAGWECVGETKGYSCKRIGGHGTDCWSGRRVWITEKTLLRPKLVLCYKKG